MKQHVCFDHVYCFCFIWMSLVLCCIHISVKFVWKQTMTNNLNHIQKVHSNVFVLLKSYNLYSTIFMFKVKSAIFGFNTVWYKPDKTSQHLPLGFCTTKINMTRYYFNMMNLLAISQLTILYFLMRFPNDYINVLRTLFYQSCMFVNVINNAKT